jgi:serine/threonine protein kinase
MVPAYPGSILLLEGAMWTPRRCGELIGGQYEIVAGPREQPELMGGMGCVYLCIDRRDRRPVALKTLRPELVGHSVRDRLLREATVWVRLGNHANIVQAYGVDTPDDGAVYLVLQLIAAPVGETAASLRAQARRHAPPDRALLVGLHVAYGMRHATDRIPGLVHRDLKPENILVGADGAARVTDFGLAHTLASLDEVGTQDGSFRRTRVKDGIVGTPLYMSPEQWRIGPLDQRTDVYALGCILKELMSGAPAVSGATIEAVAAAHLGGAAAEMGKVPIGLHTLLRRMLALAPAERFSSWADLTRALAGAYTAVTGKPAPTASTSESSVRDEADAFLGIGFAYDRIGSHRAAADAFAHARQLSESINDGPLTADSVFAQAAVLMETGQPRDAVPLLKWAGKWYLENANPAAAAKVVGTLGQAERKLGELDEALRHSTAALDLLQALGDRKAIAIELLHKANTLGCLEDYQKALECHMESARLADALGDEALLGMNLCRMGLIYAALGMGEGSRHSLRHASLLYLRAGREDYAKDVRDALEQFKSTGLFSEDTFELDMDALFGAPPQPRALVEVVMRHPGLMNPRIAATLVSTQAAQVGFECTARAMREHGTILAAIAQYVANSRK